MSLFTRNKLPQGGTYSGNELGGEGLSKLVTTDPLSTHFESPCGDRPSDLKNFMRALHIRQYGYTLGIDDRVLIRNLKILLKKYDPLLIKRGIKFASQTSDFPFATGYVERMIEQVKEKMM